MKSQHSLLHFGHFTNFFLRLSCLFFAIIASNCATVRESVFKIEFRVVAGEFESIETSPGFARLLDEN